MTRTVLIVNGAKLDSEGAEALRGDVAAAFAAVGWSEPELKLTTPDDHGGALAAAAVRDGATLVVACGGDGTVNVVAQALADTGVALGIIPLGTGNLLAANLGIPTAVDGAVTVLTGGVDRPVDLGQTGDRVFTGMAGLGLDAAMVADAPASLKRRFGWPAYLVSLARHLGDRPISVTLDLDGRRVRHHSVRTLLIGNIGRIRGGIDLLPEAVVDDGLLDVVVLAPHGGPPGWIKLLTHLIRPRAGGSDTVLRHQARHIVVHTRHRVAQEVDGEPLRHDTVMDVRVRPGALLVRAPLPPAPEHGPDHDPDQDHGDGPADPRSDDGGAQ